MECATKRRLRRAIDQKGGVRPKPLQLDDFEKNCRAQKVPIFGHTGRGIGRRVCMYATRVGSMIVLHFVHPTKTATRGRHVTVTMPAEASR